MELMDDLSSTGDACGRKKDEQSNGFQRCHQRYSRLYTEAEQKVHYAYTSLEEAEGAVRAARSNCDRAERALDNAEDEYDQDSAIEWLREAQEELADAEEEQEKAQAALARARNIASKLSAVWETHGPAAESALERVEDSLYAYNTLAANSSRDLGTFISMMEQARSALHGNGIGGGVGSALGGAAAAAAGGTAVLAGAVSGVRAAASAGISAAGAAASAVSAGRTALGWCRRNSMQAVSVGEDNQKYVSMRIGGKDTSFLCTKAGIARAHRMAVRSGDADLIARTSAMFEIETLREDLELTAGEDAVQLGGYHRDVKGQDPSGYESHHIPSRSVQDADADWLPALSISKDDHRETFSYAGKQRRVYQPFLPDSGPRPTYQQEMSQSVSEGSSGYVAAVRNELYDLRVSTGHKYDGGISAYLDAVIDMLAGRGLPGSR